MIQFCRCLRAIRGTTLFRAKPISPAPWETSLAKVKLPESSHSIYEQIGREIVNKILPQDAGLETYKECMSARHQLEIVLRSCGYDLEVKFFGGLVTLGFFEVSGDLDLVGVGDTEPRHEEAAAVVQRVARELRRIAMRPMAIPRARIPVVRCDRTSVVMPGTPIPREAACVNFPFSRPLTEHEVRSFEERLKEQFGAVHAFPKEDNQFFMAQFRSTIQAIQAMASLRRHGEVEIPVRAPVDTRYGPELYRFPFDLCFGTSGMQNTFLMREAMMSYPGARYLLLALKKWGKATGTINSMEGFLASYAYTAMLSHLLLVMDRIKPLRPEQLHEPQLLPAEPQYVPLEKIEDLNLADIGYIFTNFFVYYNHVFDYTNHVVSSTSKCLEKSRLNWDVPEEQSSGKPPFYSFSIKDPYGSDNIARSIDSNRLRYIKDALALAMHVLEEEIDDGAFAINHLLSDPPKPDLKQPLSYAFAAEDERRQSLKKQLKNTADRKTEYGAAAVQRRKTTMIANDITESVVDWFKK